MGQTRYPELDRSTQLPQNVKSKKLEHRVITKTSQRFLSCEGMINGILAGLAQACVTKTTRSISPTVWECASCVARRISCSARAFRFSLSGMRMEIVFLVPHTIKVGVIPPCLYMSCLALFMM
jgi:hypothetical protein